MNKELKDKTSTSGKIWSRLFVGILALHALVELGIGLAILIDFSAILEAGFGISYNSEIEILGMIIGLKLLLLASLAILSVVWINKGNSSGITIGIMVGIYLFAFGIVAFIKFGDIQAIMVDSLRGLLTIIFGYMASKELKS